MIWKPSIFCLFVIGLVIASQAANATNRVFLLDTSKSMKRNGLFSRIQTTLKNDYVGNIKPGEHLLLLSFDDEVKIQIDQRFMEQPTQEDIDKIKARINDLKAQGSHTWMSEALRITNQQVERLKRQYPDEDINIYILTDGDNDPPPRSGESPIPSIDLLKANYGNINNDRQNIYLVDYGKGKHPGEPPTSSVVKLINIGKTFGVLPEIRIHFQGFDWGTIGMQDDPITQLGEIVFDKVNSSSSGQMIRFEVNPSTALGELFSEFQPMEFIVPEEGKSQAITFFLQKAIQSGKHRIAFTLSGDNLIISPNRLELDFEIVRPDKTDTIIEPPKPSYALDIVLALVLVCAMIYIIIGALRRRIICVKSNNDDLVHTIEIHAFNSTSLDIIGLPNDYLKFGDTPNSLFKVFVFNDVGKITGNEVKPGLRLVCQGLSGEVDIEFVECQTLRHKSNENANKTFSEDPDFFMSDPNSRESYRE